MLIVLVVFCACAGVVLGGVTYRAAVFDQAVLFLEDTSTILSRGEALRFLQPKFELYEKQCAQAQSEGVDIIVFPEYGLAPGLLTLREVIAPFLEVVPDPAIAPWNPCHLPSRHPDSIAVHRLSCMAHDYGLYLVANVGTKVRCDAITDAGCPQDGRYQYNTNVVFDPTGRLIVRTYKMHIFSTEYRTYDSPTERQNAVFDTSFGRFVTFICYDVLFHESSIALIEEYDVDSVAFSTAWLNVLPHFYAVPFHGGFAASVGVNFLSANLRLRSFRCDGSALFTPRAALAYRSNPDATTGDLLIADLPVKAPKWLRGSTEVSEVTRSVSQFRAKIFTDMYDFVELTPDGGTVAVCQRSLCCQAVYEHKDKSVKELYVLGAFDGIHTEDGEMYLQVCAVLKCSNTSRDSCGAEVLRAQTHFAHVNVTGSFRTSHVYPMVISDGGTPSSGEWTYDGKSIDARALSRPLVSAILLARVYQLDPAAQLDRRPLGGYLQLALMTLTLAVTVFVLSSRRPWFKRHTKRE